jgi:signal transduction histidine kinase
MNMRMFEKYRTQSKEYGIPVWKLPDILLIGMALVNIVIMIVSYWWISSGVDDPTKAILPIALEAVIILIVGNIIAETSKEVIDNQKLKKEFINIISHQMRTPLTAAKWSLELLKKEKDVEKREKYIDRTIEANKRMMSIVNDFVHLARMSDEVKEIKIEKFEISEIIKGIIRNDQFFSEVQDVKIIYENKEGEIWVNADKLKTEIVFNNLIDNALKYSPSHTKIEVILKKENRGFVGEIRDHGIGINSVDKKYIFTKFYRSANARRSCSSGTGIGLYICKVIVGKMKGNIYFKSEEGVGTSFFVAIPLYDKN